MREPELRRVVLDITVRGEEEELILSVVKKIFHPNEEISIFNETKYFWEKDSPCDGAVDLVRVDGLSHDEYHVKAYVKVFPDVVYLAKQYMRELADSFMEEFVEHSKADGVSYEIREEPVGMWEDRISDMFPVFLGREKHHMVLQFKAIAPYAGCFWEWQYIIFESEQIPFLEEPACTILDPRERIFRVVYDEGIAKRYRDMLLCCGDNYTLNEAIDCMKKDRVTFYLFNLACSTLSEDIPEGTIRCFSQLNDLLNPTYRFTWVCPGCGDRFDTDPIYRSSRGLGGIAIQDEDPVCEGCYEFEQSNLDEHMLSMDESETW